MYAIKFKSALKNGKSAIVSKQMLQGNIVPAFNLDEVKHFGTDIQAQKFVDLYLQPGEQAVIIPSVETLDKEFWK